MQQSHSNIISTLSIWLVIAVTFFLPIFLLPVTLDSFEFPKYFLLVMATLLLLVLWVIKAVLNRKFTLTVTRFTLPLFLFTAANIASLLLVSPNKIQPLIIPTSTGTIIVLFLWYLLLSDLAAEKKRLSKIVLTAFLSSTSLLSLINLVNFTEITANFPIPEFIKSQTFTPAGSQLTLLSILIVAVFMGGAFLTLSFLYRKEPQFLPNIPLTAALIISLIGLSISLYQVTVTNKPIHLPYWAGWSIAVEGIKESKSALLGVGPGNFLTAFTTRRPVSLNTTPFWNIRFAVASNYYFQLITEAGLFAFFGLLLFSYHLFKATIPSFLNSRFYNLSLLIGILVILALYFFIPANMVLLFLTFSLSAIVGSAANTSYTIRQRSIIIPLILAALTAAATGALLYFGGRVFLAEVSFNQALNAIRNNQAQQAYEKSKEAILLNPFIDNYHITYAQTNAAIAAGLSRKDKDSNSESISRLIQQAVRAGKSAVAVNPTRAGNWENLASLYAKLINSAEDADTWTIKSYQQAIRLDPTNVQLRLKLGGVYYLMEHFDEAIDQFKLAIQLKPDYANAYYNLASAYREKGDVEKAIDAMQKAVQYTPKDSPDFNKAKEELEKLKSR